MGATDGSKRVPLRAALMFALAVACAHASVLAIKVWTHPSRSVLAAFRVGELHEVHGEHRTSTAQPDFVTNEGYPLEKGGTGTDGQQYLFVAHDLFARRGDMLPFVDSPKYRWGRFLLPALASGTCGGSSPCIPRAMIGWNLLFAGGIGCLLFLLVKEIGASPWWAALLSMGGGLVCATDIVGIEVAAQFFGLLGVWLAWREKPPWAALAFALAVLSRETYALVPLGFAAASFLKKEWRTTAIYGAAIGPYVAWALYLRRVLPPDDSGTNNLIYPLGGPIVHVREWLHDPRVTGGTVVTVIVGGGLLVMIALHLRTALSDRSGLSLAAALFCALALVCHPKVWVRAGGFARGLDFLYPGIVLTALAPGRRRTAAWASLTTLVHTLNLVGDHFS